MSASSGRWDTWDLALMLLALGGSGFGVLASAGLAVLAVVAAWQGAPMDAFVPVWASVAFGALAALGLPAIYWSLRRLLGGDVRQVRSSRPIWGLALALFPVSLGLGYLAFETESLPEGFGLLAHLLAAGAPVLVTAAVAQQVGPQISIRRRWGHFLAGLWAVPPMCLVLELLALVPLLALLVIGLSVSSEGRALLDLLAESPMTSEADLRRVFGEMLSQPWLIVLTAGYLALLVPLLEEAMKTMAVWPLLGRRISPSEAFLGGLLGGTGYALFESLFLPQPGGDWAATMLARGGTPLIHGLCTATACWGLVQAVSRGHWGRLMAAFAGSVGLHGIWNLGAVTLGISAVWPPTEPGPLGLEAGRALGLASAVWLFALSGLALLGLLYGLRRLMQGDAAAQPDSSSAGLSARAPRRM